jgi:hypothetical protein
MTSNDVTFFFKKASNTLDLRFLEARQGAASVTVYPDAISYAVSNVFTRLIAIDAPKYEKAILGLSVFSVTFSNSEQQSLKVVSGDVEIHLSKLSEQTAALFLKSICTPPKQASATEKLVGAVKLIVSPGRHFTKWTKYRLIQEQLEHFTRSKGVQLRTQQSDDSPIDHEITAVWNALIEALLQPTHFQTPDDQYRKTVVCLRQIRQMLISSNLETQKKFAGQLQFVRELSYVRFAGIELFPYCYQLIEIACGEPLPLNLTLDTFKTEFTRRTTKLKSPAGSTAMNPFSCEMNRAKGTFNIDFDPNLKTSNIPYQDGRITINNRSTLLLWHGTPVIQHDPHGSINGALSSIPIIGSLIPDNDSVSRPPVITDDYIAFIEGAAQKKQKILHVILENGIKKKVGDESARVKARIRLGAQHENFFPMALNLDGNFFERHGLPHDQVESLQSLKNRFKEQLLPDLDNDAQMEDQLEKTGFFIPKKLRDACKLKENIDFLLDEVQKIYFSGAENIKTQEEHQAFLILSYVHIILFICWKIDISILEALCKDDKDRGNVIKTILKLHFLYITGQINHENLTTVLTQALARPFILQKGPIVKSRLILLERVIPFIDAAHTKVAVPQTNVFGQPVKTASYLVTKPPGQTIYPNNAISKTAEEYRAFLENHQPIQIPLSNKLTEESAPMLQAHLNGIFANPSLGITVELEKALTKEINISGLKFDAVFTITDGNVSYGSIKALMKDHKTGSQIEYSLIPRSTN